MTTAAAPVAVAPMPAVALLDALAFDTEIAERAGELFDTYFVRKISAPALVEAIETVAGKLTARLPGVTVATYVDAYTGPALAWCAEHRCFTSHLDATRCREVDYARQWEISAPCYLAAAEAATVEVYVEGLPMWGEWAVGGILTRDAVEAVVATTVGASRDDALFAHRYSHLMGECVHCGLNRNRNTTILLVSDATGEVRPVGKTCLTEYTGGKIRVEALAAMTSLRERFAQEVGGVLTAEDATAPTVDIVALAARYIDIQGRYVRTGDYGPTHAPTADLVRGALFHKDGGKRPAVLVEDLTAADRASAAAMIELVMGEATDSNYVLNLQAVAAADWAQITGRRNRVGLLASLPTAAMKISERAAKVAADAQRASAAVNAWIETPGVRRTFTGTVATARHVEVDGYTGGTEVKTMLIIDTTEGTIKVFGNVNWPNMEPDFEWLVGQPISLTATIAKTGAFDEFRGVRQTKVQRVKVAKVGPDA